MRGLPRCGPLTLVGPMLSACASVVAMTAWSSAAGAEAEKVPSLFQVDREWNTKLEMTPKQSALLARIKKDPTAADVQVTKVDLSAFDASSMRMDFAPDVRVIANRKGKTGFPDKGFRWHGAVLEPGGVADFVVRGERSMGSVKTPKYLYTLEPLGGGLHAVVKRDLSKLPKDHPPSFEKVEKASRDRAAPKPEADTPGLAPGCRTGDLGMLRGCPGGLLPCGPGGAVYRVQHRRKQVPAGCRDSL